MYPIFSERLSIQPLGISDLDPFVEYRQDPDIARFQSWDPSYSAHQAIELINSQFGMMIPEPGQWLQLAVHSKLNAELLGDLALHSVEQGDSVFELGFTFSKRHQGKGLAKESVTRVMDHLSSEVGAQMFIANTDERNASAIKLLTSLGFSNVLEKKWTENFKNELVTVYHFQRASQIESRS